MLLSGQDVTNPWYNLAAVEYTVNINTLQISDFILPDMFIAC